MHSWVNKFTSDIHMKPSQAQALDPMQWLSFKRTAPSSWLSNVAAWIIRIVVLALIGAQCFAVTSCTLTVYACDVRQQALRRHAYTCTCETPAQKWGKNFLRALIIYRLGSEEKLTLTPARKHLTFATFRLHCDSLPQAFSDMMAKQNV